MQAKVLTVRKMCADSKIYELVLTSKEVFPKWKPGQFVMLKLRSSEYGISFARPFSIATADAKHLTLYIQIQGKETAYIQHLHAGNELSLWGSLGTSFSNNTKKTLLIAGGIGIAPFLGYTQQYHNASTQFLFGHRLPLSHYPYDAIANSCIAQSFHDTDSTSLMVFLETIRTMMQDYTEGKVLACGPLPLLRTIQKYALDYNIDTELSVEEKMFCGIGACLGCVCKTTEAFHEERLRSTFVQSCTYGPVFKAISVIL